MNPTSVLTVRAGVLDLTVERSGTPGGWPVVLLHGFPYDARCYDRVVDILSEAGADVVVPHLRGYGGTRFVAAATMRSGQQAALGYDLLELIDALHLTGPIVAGYDWGGRAACVASALRPGLIAGLVTASGYNVQAITAESSPKAPATERTLWYQYYLHGERGRKGLSAHRREYARLLWQEWSPTWAFTDTEFEATAPSLDNPDFVDVVVHSYRHRFGLVPGDSAYDAIEKQLAAQPKITVPTIVLDGLHDTVTPPRPRSQHESHFPALMNYRQVDAGHNIPQENPSAFARAVIELRGMLT